MLLPSGRDYGSLAQGNVVVETSLGTFVVELYWREAPRTCRNFYELARRRFYDETPFHRIVKGFVIQGGDPTGTGHGGQSIYGPTFADEVTPTLRHTGAGILSMANAGPDTNGSQFFVTLAPQPTLDGKHAIFGRVCAGMDTIERLSRVAVDAHDRPVQAARIIRAYPDLARLE